MFLGICILRFTAMLEIQFLLINAHFTANLFAALVCFAVAWLYFDAWLGRKDLRESTKSLGFFLLCLSFVLHAATVEQALLTNSLFRSENLTVVANFLRIIGYIVLIIGQVMDPLQPLPEYRYTETAAFLSIPFLSYPTFVMPVLATITGFLYLRRATTGLEHHLKPISLSFYLLSITDTLSTHSLFRGTANVDLENTVRAFSPVWIIEHVVLVFAMFFLGRWVWGYLIKRLETQLFMIFTISTLMIFLITAIFFTTVTIINLRQDILENLKINASVLEFSIDSKKAEALSDAQVIAQNQDVIDALEDRDIQTLNEVTQRTLLAKNQAFLTIVLKSGEVVSRADDPEKVGGSLSGDPIVSKALAGTETTSIITTEGVIAPNVSVKAAVPIKKDSEILGAAVVGTTIDNAFVDGLKEATGLDASIYGDNVRSATTFIAPDGKSRYIGIKEETESIKKTVLIDGEQYSGNVTILNVPYLSAFTPLLDSENTPVGMLFVGRPQTDTIRSAGKLIEQTFLVTVVLLATSIVPAYFISNYIIDQVNA